MIKTGKYEITDLGMINGNTIYLFTLVEEGLVFYAIRVDGELRILFERKGNLIDDLKQLIEKENINVKKA